MDIEILYRCEQFIAVNKPSGLLVHRTQIASDATEFLLQILNAQIGKHLYPVHRLDRPTSGVLLFALDAVTAKILSEMLVNGSVVKEYRALVRGWFTEEVALDYPVKNDRGNLQSAQTSFLLRERFEVNMPIGNYSLARYSIISCYPHTGRWHQIRQHLAHLRHYIVNDRVHGDGKHNRVFKNELHIEPMFLHACLLQMIHPFTKELLRIEANYPLHWQQFRELDGVEMV